MNDWHKNTEALNQIYSNLKRRLEVIQLAYDYYKNMDELLNSRDWIEGGEPSQVKTICWELWQAIRIAAEKGRNENEL